MSVSGVLRVFIVLAAAVTLAGPVAAQGFAGLGTEVEGFAIPERGTTLTFPQDHGPHPDFRIEWWYLTANLTDAEGTRYGIQWTLFRNALRPGDGPGWDSPQIWMGHAGLTTPTGHFVAERLARGGIGQAGVTAVPFNAHIDDWALISTAAVGEDAMSSLTLEARGMEFAYDLALTADGPLVLHGDEGYSVKSAEGKASFYYSQPFYSLTGTLHLPTGPVAVTGEGWLDREWSSQPLAEDQTGWDWFSLLFDDGARMMIYGMRGVDGSVFTSATWIGLDGTAAQVPANTLRMTPMDVSRVAGRDVPTVWRLELPERGLDIVTRPLNSQSWMETQFPYWEGPIRFEGSHTGRGYLEMTGYQ